MRFSTFKRGVHPHDNKSATNSLAIETLDPKPNAKLVFPMSQHLGAPCEPLVAVGDTVLMGQKIAEGNGFISTTIHSSVSGTVTDIKDVAVVNGSFIKSIIIENDGKDTKVEGMGDRVDYKTLSYDEIIERVKQAGIVGLGGAGFPTQVKLNAPKDKPIDYIIVNAAECEPYLTTDHRVMLEHTDELVQGLEIMLSLHPNARGIIGIETNKQDAIDALSNALLGKTNIELVGLVPKYPQGAEKQLIKATVNREVPSGGLPTDCGCIVNNVDTVRAIYKAVALNTPLITRVVTITGDCAVKPCNVEVRIGTILDDLLAEVGGIKEKTYKMVAGGPMMGVAFYKTDVPLIKTSSAFLFLSKEAGEMPPERNCICCAACVNHCPMGLMPLELNYYALIGDLESFEKYNGVDCIECGSCSYICPSKRHLAQTIRFARGTVLANRRKR